jgi:hypothetical protein
VDAAKGRSWRVPELEGVRRIKRGAGAESTERHGQRSRQGRGPARREPEGSGTEVRGASGAVGLAGAGAWRGACGEAGGHGGRTSWEQDDGRAMEREPALAEERAERRTWAHAWPERQRCGTLELQTDSGSRAPTAGARPCRTGEEHGCGIKHGGALRVRRASRDANGAGPEGRRRRRPDGHVPCGPTQVKEDA